MPNNTETKKGAKRNIAQNKKAYHDYFVEETLEAGIELCGTEVKSLRAGNVNLKDSYCEVDKGELFLQLLACLRLQKSNTSR